MTKLLVAAGDGCSLTSPNCLGLSRAGHSNLKKMNPETTLVLTNLSSGHLAITAFCRQPQMYRTDLGQASGDINMLKVTYRGEKGYL